MEKKAPVGIIVWTVALVVGSFLPWGTLRGSMTFNLPDIHPAAMRAFRSLPMMSIPINGWKGQVTLVGVELPNWLPVICGVAVGVFGLLAAASVWKAPPAASIVLSSYGIVHMGFVLAVFIKSSSSVGIGLLVSVASFIALLMLSVRAALPQRRIQQRQPT
jgi:hypothetical protein